MPSKNTCLQGCFCDGIHEQTHFEKMQMRQHLVVDKWLAS